jgi:outer membrane receptor protein involved in Fe transport
MFSARPSDRVSFLGGLFLFKESGSNQNILPVQTAAPCQLTASCSPGPAPDFTPVKGVDYIFAPLQLRGQIIKNKSLGAYANMSWEFIDGLTAAGGIRLSAERKRADLDSRFLSAAFPIVIASGSESFSDDVVLFDGRLNWKASEDALLYVKYGTGYRVDGVGFRAAATRFNPETVKTWKWAPSLTSTSARCRCA